MGKITVKHYLNTNLKPYVIDGEKYYKIYVLIRSNTQNTKVKSDISNAEFTEKEFKKLTSDRNSELSQSIDLETKLIEFIVNKLNDDKKIFTASLYSEYSRRFKTPIGEFINKHNSYHDPLFSARADRYIDFGDRYEEIVKGNLFAFRDLMAANYEIGDLYMVQWFLGNTKEQIEEFYKRYLTIENPEMKELKIKSNIQQLEREIKSFLNLG